VKYQTKLSGPLLDRIDLRVDVDRVEHASLLSATAAEASFAVHARVASARQRQVKRFSEKRLNSHMTNQQLKQEVSQAPAARHFLDRAAAQLQLSPRAYMRCIKVARTIADLAGHEDIANEHVAEALQFRERQTAR
jgi:magnesium chelatase family protein